MAATERSFFSGALKPASSLPFQASLSESPSVKAISPRPACSRFRFSAGGLGCLDRGLGARQGLAVDLRQCDAERVIDAAGAAREYVDEFGSVAGGGAGSEVKRQAAGCEAVGSWCLLRVGWNCGPLVAGRFHFRIIVGLLGFAKQGLFQVVLDRVLAEPDAQGSAFAKSSPGMSCPSADR